jgi:hypothetical protein
LKAAGDLTGAMVAWDRGLRALQPQLPVLVELLREMAAVEETVKGKAQAAARWKELWEKVRDSGSVMTSTRERVAVLDRLIQLYLDLNNPVLASQYRVEKRRRYPTAG